MTYDERGGQKKDKLMRDREFPKNAFPVNRQFYNHSGKLSAQLILGIPLVLIVTILLAFIYAYAVVYIPIIGYLSVLFTIGFALGVGYSTASVLQFFKTRNTTLAVIIGLFVGLFALYAAWVTFEYALWNRDSPEPINLLRLAARPQAVWQLACLIAEKGWYSLRNFTPKGAVLWTFWGIEALIICGASVYLPYSFIAHAVFCETCSGWAHMHANNLSFQYEDEHELKKKLTHQDMSFLDNIIKLKTGTEKFYRIECMACDSCDRLFTLSLLRIKRTWDKNGKEQEKRKFILKHLYISKETFERLTGKKKEAEREKAEEKLNYA